MKFGIFYEHQLPRPWRDGDESTGAVAVADFLEDMLGHVDDPHAARLKVGHQGRVSGAVKKRPAEVQLLHRKPGLRGTGDLTMTVDEDARIIGRGAFSSQRGEGLDARVGGAGDGFDGLAHVCVCRSC